MKQTMKALSIQEVENARKLDFMIPMNISGRFQILTKLKDLTVDISEVIVKPVKFFPAVIRKAEAFFSVDGYWSGNFMVYGTGLSGKEIFLWDDITVEDMVHYDGMVETSYMKRKLDYNKPVTLITATKQDKGYALVFHCYLP